ncbi:unnamed protein product [Durusdinium trenchii]|uniref:RRP15-like protein n=1 Tax=Durusdinium trenchii TaxID=1381693 RepID=A0ABP0M8M0_9DINO
MKFKKKKKFVAAKSTKSDQDVDEKEEEVVPSTVGKLEEAGWKGFCTAFTNILSRELKTSQTPILAETEVEEKLQKSKAEFKEKKLQALENRVEKDKGHEAVNILEKNFEMQLRKYATQGVVRLFNAVKEYQAHAGDDKAEKYKFNKMPLRQRAKLMAESKKEKFENALKKTTTKKDKKLKGQTTARARRKERPAGSALEHNMLDEFG